MFDRHYPQIHGYVMRRVGHSYADDIAANTFLVAFARRERYDVSRADARPWLYGIASNLIAQHHRAEQRRYRALARSEVAKATEGARRARRRAGAAGRYGRLLVPQGGALSEDFEQYGDENPQTIETWTVEDGRAWSRNLCCPGIHESSQFTPGLQFGRSLLTYEELQDLPTDPEQLKTRITELVTEPIEWPTPGPDLPIVVPEPAPLEPPYVDDEVAWSLAGLLYRVPAPPEVRAAAFRALAAMPEVTSLGAVDGGEGLRISLEPSPADKFSGGEVPEGAGSMTLVIDPDTSKVLSVSTYRDTVRILAAEWTDQGPPSE